MSTADLVRPTTVLDASAWRPLAEPLQDVELRFAQQHPGDTDRHQPVHTFYGGAQLFRAGSIQKMGARALRTLEEYAPHFGALARALRLPGADRLPDAEDAVAASVVAAGIEEDPDAAWGNDPDDWLAYMVYRRTVDKLKQDPVEDYRIDFEDGYGRRSDTEEDGHAQSAAREVAKAFEQGKLPTHIGIRVKPVNQEGRERSIRTLDLFLTTLLGETGGRLPPNFVVTLPKVTVPAEAAFFAGVLELLEGRLNLPKGSLNFEFMVETPQIVMDADGRSPLPAVIEAARGRAVAAHFGTYDYTAACNITAAYQRVSHPACGFARSVMQVAFAGTGVWLADGPTLILPIPPYRAEDGERLTEDQERRNREVVHRAWRLHYEDIQDSLMRGFYQSWDLHPAQLVSRYAAVFAFFLRRLPTAAERLSNFIDRAARASRVGDVFDDAASGQGLINYFLRGINSGAITEQETLERTGLALEELQTRSFVKILDVRRR